MSVAIVNSHFSNIRNIIYFISLIVCYFVVTNNNDIFLIYLYRHSLILCYFVVTNNNDIVLIYLYRHSLIGSLCDQLHELIKSTYDENGDEIESTASRSPSSHGGNTNIPMAGTGATTVNNSKGNIVFFYTK